MTTEPGGILRSAPGNDVMGVRSLLLLREWTQPRARQSSGAASSGAGLSLKVCGWVGGSGLWVRRRVRG